MMSTLSIFIPALVLVWFELVVVHGQPKSQYEVNCWQNCVCDAVEYRCAGLNLKNADVFQHMIPQVYNNLDTVVVTGNDFRNLPAENIFGQNVRHERLSLLDLSRNRIESFGTQTFIGASRVETLRLAHNSLTDFADPMPLNFLTSLRVLDLKDVFGRGASSKRRADLIRQLFNNNHSFVDLYEIDLSDNELRFLHPDTFCMVKGLSRLILNNNQLTDFSFHDRCLDGLAALELRHNLIMSVPSRIWKTLPSISTFDFSRNPLKCDCEAQKFHEFALDEENSFVAQTWTIQQETSCAAPQRYRGKSIFSVSESFCRGQAGGPLVWLILLTVAGVVLFAYWQYRKGARPTITLFKGYSQLQSDTPTQPAFV